MTGPDGLPPQEQLEHWHSELARVLKASPNLTWASLIDWAEEAEHFALKACTKSGRARLAGLEERAKAAEAEAERLTRELAQARNAKLAEAEPRLAAMEKLAAAWQKEAERAREDCAVPADMDDVAQMRIWDALERPLTMEEVAEHIQILRYARHLAVNAIEIASGTYEDATKRIQDVLKGGPSSGAAIGGEWENGWDAAMEAVTRALHDKEPTT
ncbi:hypothetical protein [Streptomyces sp. NPDC047868]|uniref:hypothetical protein n=1 Tax=Streptomyces sp. NPDC047868 TaxID=3155480 RepID=UPI00345138F2